MDITNDYISKFLGMREETGFRDLFKQPMDLKSLVVSKEKITIDWIYTIQHVLAQRILLETKSRSPHIKKAIDIGSQFSFVSQASAFLDFTVVEPRVENTSFVIPDVCSVNFVNGEAQDLPFDEETFDVCTSLHAIEHFGLGRYGDTIDYFGDQRGLREMCRVMKKGGIMIVSVPTCKDSVIEFNGQRRYNPDDFDSITSDAGFEKQGGFFIVPGSPPLTNDPSFLQTYNPTWSSPAYFSVNKKI